MFGWIPWTLSLSYETLLNGVPGTGTRKGGMEGAMLKVNLDGIMLLRFHALALKVITLTTVLAIGVILPMNYTGECFTYSGEPSGVLGCGASTNITQYERTTIENIPKLAVRTDISGMGSIKKFLTVLGAAYDKNLIRLYIVVLFSCIIVRYTMRLLSKEWADALALRRVYYLESSHFENRRQELEETAEYMDSSSDEDEEEQIGIRTRRQLNKPNKNKNFVPKVKRKRSSKLRQPWIPHPEQRETVPNIELYSVLVGNIPSKPSDVMEGDDNIEAALGGGEEGSLHWQLEVATTFFDQCVPNQPGFSSSVAAITILPDAPKLALAWRKWYRHVGLLRKLRFVRLLIADMRHYDLDEMSNNDANSRRKVSTADHVDENHNHNGHELHESLNMNMIDNAAISDELWKRMNYKYDVFGTDYEEDVVSLLVQAMNYGPEQTAVYSREFAQSASACCPNGCAEERTRDLRIDELLDLEAEVKHMVEDSFNELKDAQDKNVINKSGKLHADANKTPHDFPNINELHENRTHRVENKDSATGVTVDSQSTKKHVDVEVILNNNNRSLPTIPSALCNEDVCGQNIVSSDKGPNDLHAANTYEVDNLKQRDITSSRRPNFISPMKNIRVEPKHFLEDTYEPRAHTVSDLSGDAAILNELQDPVLQIPEELPVRHASTRSTSIDTLSLATGNSSRSRRLVSMSNNGKVYARDVIPLHSSGTNFEENDISNLYSIDPMRGDSISPVRKSDRSIRTNTNTPGSQFFGSTPPVYSTRRRLNTGNSYISSSSGRNKSDQWAQAEEITKSDARTLTTGVWHMPDVKKLPDQYATSFKSWVRQSITDLRASISQKTRGVVNDMSSDATFAVVTFTSRQAAVAARQCLADGRGLGKWEPVQNIPVPPLADAAVCDFKTCRGCCRPVSLTAPREQQFVRKIVTWGILATLALFATVVITYIASLIAPDKLKEVIPFLNEVGDNPLIQGIIPALLFALFFAICPIIFKAISNFGSNAVSVNHAEETAIEYYWWFMLVTIFIGSSLGKMILNAFNEQKDDDNNLTTVLIKSATSLATQTSANWLNWIIFRTFLTLPLMYMLQVNSFIFGFIGWRCCRRCVMGGGPGGPVPYRIYIDSGVVFLCAVTLSPIAPLVAPVSLLYFLYCTPLLRRNLIFMYRPKFDSGGLRWPFLADMFISSMVVGQILLSIVMGLEQAGGPAIIAAASVIPILLHRRSTRQQYYKSYMDAALLQTSQLDTWDASLEETTEDRREQYRKFLVDAHKAAYVPICIAGGISEELTAEPAVVVPHENDLLTEEMNTLLHNQDEDIDNRSFGTMERPPSPMTVMTVTTATPRYIERANQQLGASLRRYPAAVTADENISLRSRSYSNNTGKPPLHQYYHTT